MQSVVVEVPARRAWRLSYSVAVVAVILVGVIGASLLSIVTRAAETVMPVVMPLTVVGAFGLMFGLYFPSVVSIGLESGALVVAARHRSFRLPIAGARLRWARWQPSQSRLGGSVVVIETPRRCLRLATPHVLPDHHYDAPATGAHDFILDPGPWATLTAQLVQALGAPPATSAGGATYTIALRRNRARAFDPALLVYIPGMWGFVGLAAATPLLWPAPAAFVTLTGVLVVVATLVAFARHRHRHDGRRQLVVEPHGLRLVDTLARRELASAPLAEVQTRRGVYVVRGRVGSFTAPVLSLTLPGWPEAIPISARVDGSDWAPGARSGAAARYAIGPEEWAILVGALRA